MAIKSVLIRENIKAFENANGTIDGDIAPTSNVKPTRKQQKLSAEISAESFLFYLICLRYCP